MLSLRGWRVSRQALTLLLAVFLAGLLARPGAAQKADNLKGSLQWVPADAAFYSAMLRNDEQIQAIAQSRAWAKLKAMPAVQLAWRKMQEDLSKPDGPLTFYQELVQKPEGQEALALVRDMLGHEIFLYGGENTTGFLDLSLQLVSTLRFGPLMQQLKGEHEEPSKAPIRLLLQTLMENEKLLRAPDLIVGFKLTNTERAQTQLKCVEEQLQTLLGQEPRFKDKLQRKQIGNSSFLTLTLDGSMVPWEEMPLKEFEKEPGQYDELVKKLKQLTLTFSLGVRDGYLLIALGESTAPLEKLGQGKRLVDRPELQPLARFADRRLTSISYVSQAMNEKANTTRADIDNLLKVAQEGLQKAPLSEEKRKQAQKDLNRFAEDWKKFIPHVGAVLSFAFLTERGQESYTYNWAEHMGLDGSKPLTLLNHMGGAPLLALVGRTKYAPENYRLFVNWVQVIHGYIEDLVLPNLNDDQKEQYEQIAVKIVYPLLRDLDQITGKMLLPSLADGQSALVLDAKWQSKQWLASVPATEQPMPMLQPALVCGVSNAALLRQAFTRYREALNEAVNKVRAMGGGRFPVFEIPAPESRDIQVGTLYYYALPELLGLDKQVLPNAGLSQKVAVLSLSEQHSKRLLTATPLMVAGGPLANTERPLAGAAFVDWANLITALTPWMERGVQQLPPPEGEDAKAVGDIPSQVRTALEILKCFRGHTSATYFEGKALVTHGETVFKDL